MEIGAKFPGDCDAFGLQVDVLQNMFISWSTTKTVHRPLGRHNRADDVENWSY